MRVYPHRSLRDFFSDYAFTGAVILLLAWVVSGCRFGNHIEYAKLADSVNGYYETSPQELTLCATAGTQTSCQAQPTNLILAELAAIMRDIVWFQTDKNAPGKAMLFSAYNEKENLPFNFDPATNELELLALPSIVEYSDSCSRHFNLEANGRIAPTEKYEVSIGGQRVPISGRVEMFFRLTTSFQGDCNDVMAILYECYLENPACETSIQTLAKSTFQPYIDAGLIAPEDIPDVTDLSDEVSYR